MSFDICTINTSQLAENKLPLITASVQITGDVDDNESFGEVASFQALGVTALPAAPTSAGSAEGIILRDVGNLNGAIVGARDGRCASVVAAMQPGDTVLHSCDPNAKAQVRVHANKQIALVTEGTDGKTMLQLLDGKNDKITITAFGGLIEMTPDGISIVAPGSKASILLNGDQISLLGKIQLGGNVPAQNVMCTLGTLLTAFKAAPTATPANVAAAVILLQGLLNTAANLTSENA